MRGDVSAVPFSPLTSSASMRPASAQAVVKVQEQEVVDGEGAGPACCCSMICVCPPAPRLCAAPPRPAVTTWPSRATRWRRGSKLWKGTSSGSWPRWSATSTPPTSQCPAPLRAHVHVHTRQALPRAVCGCVAMTTPAEL